MIHTLTLNPAIDKIIYLKEFERNKTNRMKGTKVVLGGKGTHVSINLKLLGKENTAFGVAFGSTGQQVVSILQENGIKTGFIQKPEGNTRTNYLLIEDSTDCTIIADKGVTLSDSILLELKEKMLSMIQEGDMLILSGDASNCTNPQIYNELLAALQSKRLKVFLDTSGQSLSECIKTSPFLIKPNLDELASLCGVGMETLDSDERIISAMQSLEAYGIDVIAVSLGGDGSIVMQGGTVYRAYPPQVKVFNTIGCGDCFLSGLVAGFSDQLELEDTLRLATAISAATAECSGSVGFDKKRAEELYRQVRIEKLK